MFWFEVLSILGILNSFNCGKTLNGRETRDYPLPNYGPPTQPTKWSIPYDPNCLCPSHSPSYGHLYQPPIYSQPPNPYQPNPIYKPPSDNQSSYLPNDGLPPPLIPPTLYAAPVDDTNVTTSTPEITTQDINASSTQLSNYYPSSGYYPSSYQPPNYQPPNYQSPIYQTPNYQQWYMMNPSQFPYKVWNNNWNQWIKSMINPWLNYQPTPTSKYPTRHQSNNVWPFPYMHRRPENNQQQVVYIQQPHILPILSLPPAPYDLTSRNPSVIQQTTATKSEEQGNQTTEPSETENLELTKSTLDRERIDQEAIEEESTEEDNEREQKKYTRLGERDLNVLNNTIPK